MEIAEIEPWEPSVEPGKSYARCKQCGSTDVVAVCHHCGSGLCQEHILPGEGQPWYRSFPEFADLNLDRTKMGEVAVHCQACYHYSFAFDLLVRAGLLLTVITLFLQLTFTWRNLATSLAGWFILMAELLVVFFALLFTIVDSLYHASKHTPPLPVLGTFPVVQVREVITGTISLNAAGDYTASVDHADGRLDYAVHLMGPDQTRRVRYQRKYSHRSLAGARFSAGYFVPRGAARLDFQGPAASLRRQGNIIELSAPLQHQRFLNGPPLLPGQSPPSARWTPHYTYVYELGEDLPVQLIPALLVDGEHLGLELLVQMAPWPKLDLKGVKLRVERLKLCVPEDLGEPLDWQPSARQEPPGDLCPHPERYSLVWNEVPFSSGSEADNLLAHRDLAHPFVRFYVRFANDTLLKHQSLEGQLRIRLEDKLLSGLEDPFLCFPLGKARDEATISAHSVISVGFHLNPRSLLARGKCIFERRHVFDTIPDHNLIFSLVRHLQEAGYYVKRVVDTSPQSHHPDASFVGRSWQIDGRLYQGIHPLSFNLALTGFEVYGDKLSPVRGQTIVDIRVEANVRTEQFFRKLHALRDALTDVLGRCLGTGPAPPTAGPTLGASPGRRPSPYSPRPWLKT